MASFRRMTTNDSASRSPQRHDRGEHTPSGTCSLLDNNGTNGTTVLGLGTKVEATDVAAKKKPKGPDDDETLSVQLGVRVTPSDASRLDELAARFPIAKRNAIARQALLIGLEAIEIQPTILLGEKPKKARA